MKLYEGTKRLYAQPMTRGEYNDYRNWALPEDEDGGDAGYLVEYTDGGKANDSRHAGYISWSPTDVFERSYKEVEGGGNPFTNLTFKAYTEKAMSYRLPSADPEYALMNLSGEVGELLSLFAKRRRDGPYNVSREAEFKRLVKKEIGDVLWCLAAVTEDQKATLEECGLINLVKLRDRKEAGTLQGSGNDR